MRLFPLLLLLLLNTGCAYDSVEKLDPTPCTTPALVTYTDHIAPLLQKNCGSCHNPSQREQNLNLLDYAEAKGRADTRQLLGVVSHTPGYPQMPQGGAKLSKCDIELIRAWTEAGAPQ